MSPQKSAAKGAKKGSKIASPHKKMNSTPGKVKAHKPIAQAKSHPAKAKAPASAAKPGAAAHPKQAKTATKAVAHVAAPVKAAPPAPALRKAPALKRGKKSNKPMTAEDRSAQIAYNRAALVASGETVCREVACEGLSTTAGYCRLHYIKNWKKIKRKELILKEKKLNQYIEELVAKYPDKYIEAIRQDLENDKDFAKVIYDLDLDESVDDFDADAESADSVIDSIKRDFEDEGGDF